MIDTPKFKSGDFVEVHVDSTSDVGIIYTYYPSSGLYYVKIRMGFFMSCMESELKNVWS